MRFTRLIAGLTTAGLLGLAPVAISSPAEAAVTYTTSSSIAASASQVIYGEDDLSINGAVLTAAGGSVYYGSVALQVYSAKNPVWTTIQTDDSAGSYFFFDIKPDSNSLYKVVYSGTTASNGDVYTPSESAPLAVGVQRKVVLKNPRGTLIKGKVTPDYGKKPIKVQKKVGKKWKKYKTFKTSKAGKYSFKLPAPRRGKWKWKITVKGDASYTTWSTTGTTYSYRSVAPRVSVK
ncbi:hypothetical protein [Nocardioides sediminis]|uniref:hypothetical protein n=1 Tax=Nocardioides sediminis TaxID=433648 RepID=UPI000D30C931|nr:hypothetical protein [Nocardioides sediminis]